MCFFIGDATGLADGFTGGGIHLALTSAYRLGNHFVNGVDYEVAMQKLVASMLDEYDKSEESYRERCERIQVI